MRLRFAFPLVLTLQQTATLAPALAADLPAVAVQAVAPTGDGRARVAECSGVLIAPDLVLTAGHCLDAVKGPSQIAAFAYDGERPRPKPLLVAAFARHPGHVIGWREKPGDPETRRSEIAADLAILRLAEPVAGAAPATLAGPTAAAPAASAIAGAGATGPGQPSGRMKRTALASVRLATGGGPAIAFATASGTVCGGDSGGPVVDGASRVWGVVAAVIRGSRGCGTRIVIAPVDPEAESFRRMRAQVGAR